MSHVSAKMSPVGSDEARGTKAKPPLMIRNGARNETVPGLIIIIIIIIIVIIIIIIIIVIIIIIIIVARQ